MDCHTSNERDSLKSESYVRPEINPIPARAPMHAGKARNLLHRPRTRSILRRVQLIAVVNTVFISRKDETLSTDCNIRSTPFQRQSRPGQDGYVLRQMVAR